MMVLAFCFGRTGRMDPLNLHEIAVEAMRAHALRPAFEAAAVREAQAQGPALPAVPPDVRDLTHLPWFSIDNDDTRDLDQLSVVQPLETDATRLLVAVAEVDTRVPQGSAMDEHAAANTTSVYTAAGVFPMLPQALSNDLTSLHEGQRRLAVVVDMRVEPDGAVTAFELYRAIVLNHAKLAYNGVAAWLDGAGSAPEALARVPELQEQLHLHDRLALALRQWRRQRGAVTLNTVAARPVFQDGRLADLVPEDRNRAKELIAELMIAANAATARYLAGKRFPSLRRFLQSPQRWDRIAALAAQHGEALPAAPDAPALDKFLRKRLVADPAGFADLSLSVVKLLGAGEYTAAAGGSGHFGLAVNDYVHATAPNRRFPDLVTQRQVLAAIAGQAPPYCAASLEQIARHCNVQERNANKVERQVLKAAGTFLLQDRIGHTFQGIVTGAAPKGTYVRIDRPLLEGRVVRGFEGLDVGDRVRVRLASVDPAQGFIDFELAA